MGGVLLRVLGLEVASLEDGMHTTQIVRSQALPSAGILGILKREDHAEADKKLLK